MDTQEIDEYLKIADKFQGTMKRMANSIELMLDVILKRNRINTKPKEPLGSKIIKFQDSKAILVGKYAGDFDKLVDKLMRFNTNWIIAKHGMTVLGQQDLTYSSGGRNHKFDPKRREEIYQEFTETQMALIEISKAE
ncbi:hypothetical protein ES703_70412 [subsurface metagenome]